MRRESLLGRIGRRVSRWRHALADAWSAVTSPIERSLSRLFRAATGGATRATDGLESAALGVFRAIAWPVVVLPRAIGRRLARLAPARAVRALDRVGQGAGELAGRAIRADEAGALDGLARGAAWLLWPLWRPLAGLLGFALAYLASRPWRTLTAGLPALAAASAVAAVSLLSPDDASVADPYRRAIAAASDAGDYATVERYERKLAQLGVDSRAASFRIAERLAEAGDYAGAYERTRNMAPLEGRGYVPAHWWIAVNAFERKLDLSDQERSDLILAHTQRIEALGAKGEGVALLRAAVLSERGDSVGAVDVLQPYAEQSFAAGAQRMQQLLALRRFDEAAEQAKSVALNLQTRRRQGDRLTRDEFAVWAIAADLRKDSELLATVAETWRRDEPDSDEARKLLVDIRRRQFARLVDSAGANPREIARLLSEATALGADPAWVGPALERLLRIEGRERAVEELAASPTTPPRLLEQIGVREALAGHYRQAAPLLRRVTESGDATPSEWNNFAYVLLQLALEDASEGETEETLRESLAAVEHAVASQPRSHSFRETRGQVYAALGRWSEAIEDLEFALNGMPDASPIHASLARAYDALGKAEQAAAHRNAVN